jgi:hypothetical protein
MQAKRYPCPCCGNEHIEEPGGYEICDVCGWEDDPVQSADPQFAGGANEMSLLRCRELWSKGIRPKPNPIIKRTT